MTTKGVYTRKISSEEAREGYILVLKDKLPFFPPIGEEFDLTRGGKKKKAKVESYHCTCRGPDLPHEHYFIRWKGLKAKDRVEIERVAKKQGMYLLKLLRQDSSS
ncbi:MAG: hypothetical protein WCE90_08305 [Candidatus Zixiibacteriota bacterium]